MSTRYFAALATMAAHSDRLDLRAKTLRRLVDAIEDRGAPRVTYVHDGARIIHVDDGAARLLGRRVVGRPVLSLMPAERHVEGLERLDVLRRGALNAPWSGTIVRPDGRPLLVRATVHHTTHHGDPVYRVELVDLSGVG